MYAFENNRFFDKVRIFLDHKNKLLSTSNKKNRKFNSFKILFDEINSFLFKLYQSNKNNKVSFFLA